MIKIEPKLSRIMLILTIFFVILFVLGFILNNIYFVIFSTLFLTFVFIFFNSTYKIDGNKLILKNILNKKEIKIEKITKIRNFKGLNFTDKNFSTDFSGKIQIYFLDKMGDYGEKIEENVILTPKSKQHFFEKIADINSDIDFDL